VREREDVFVATYPQTIQRAAGTPDCGSIVAVANEPLSLVKHPHGISARLADPLNRSGCAGAQPADYEGTDEPSDQQQPLAVEGRDDASNDEAKLHEPEQRFHVPPS
jgi:hypothetical protein